MKFKYQKVYKVICGLLFGISFFSITGIVNASVMYEQTSYDSNNNFFYNFLTPPVGSAYQNLGNGLYGFVDEIDSVIMFAVAPSNIIQHQILCFTDYSYSVPCVNSVISTSSDITPGAHWASTTLSTSYYLSPEKYYRLVVTLTANTNGTYYYIFGTTTNEYVGGWADTDDMLAWNYPPIDLAFKLIGTGGSPDYSTRIISTNPVSGSTKATSTNFTFGATGYINQDDFDTDMTLDISYWNASKNSSQLVGPGFLFYSETPVEGSFSWSLDDYGYFDLSTTTSVLQVGKYYMRTEINTPKFSIFGFDFGIHNLISTTTSFIVSTTTKYDVLQNLVVSQTEELIQSASEANCKIDFTTAFGMLDLKDCLFFLYTWGGQEIYENFMHLKDEMLTRAPWGYAYRIYNILSFETGTTTLPYIDAIIPAGMPGAGQEIKIDTWSAIDTSFASFATGSPIAFAPHQEEDTNFLDSIYRIWNYICYIAFAWLIYLTILSAKGRGDFS